MPLTTRIFALSAAILAIAPASFGGELYTKSINQKATKGKDLVIDFKELRRDGNISEVRILATSGASVPRIMFELRCRYEMAKQRNARYIVILKTAKADNGANLETIGFTNDKDCTIDKEFKFQPPLDPNAKLIDMDEFKSIFESSTSRLPESKLSKTEA